MPTRFWRSGWAAISAFQSAGVFKASGSRVLSMRSDISLLPWLKGSEGRTSVAKYHLIELPFISAAVLPLDLAITESTGAVLLSACGCCGRSRFFYAICIKAAGIPLGAILSHATGRSVASTVGLAGGELLSLDSGATGRDTNAGTDGSMLFFRSLRASRLVCHSRSI